MSAPSRPLRAALLATASSLLAVSACVLSPPDYSGKRCDTASDCPEPYACVLGATPGAPRTCELLYPPETAETGEPLDGGGVFYCDQVKPILDANCVLCHGPLLTSGPGLFYLDRYDGSVGDGYQGAAEMAARIQYRAYEARTMPPSYAPQRPTDAQRRALAVWAVAGAPYCGPPDGGPDGGVDGGL